MDFSNVSVDETQCAALRGLSVYTQRRHRKRKIGPKPFFPPGSDTPRYLLRDIQAEKDAEAETAAT